MCVYAVVHENSSEGFDLEHSRTPFARIKTVSTSN